AQHTLYWLIIAFTSAALVVAVAFFKTSASPETASDTSSSFFEGRSFSDGPLAIRALGIARDSDLVSPLDREWQKPLEFYIKPKSIIEKGTPLVLEIRMLRGSNAKLWLGYGDENNPIFV